MAEDTGAEEQLTLRHKKERKELQAHIQVLKKTICKGDKKKKKEVTEEISRLEFDLESKQNEESIALKVTRVTLSKPGDEKETEHDDDDDDDEIDDRPLKNTPKVSKAQKRRDKKANAERERNERIIEQETLNISGKRNVETQAIRKILVDRDLMIYEIPSDGHCLYNAIAHQLKVLGEIPLGLQELREKTSVYLRENVNDFLPFLSNPDSDESLTPEQFEKYCDNVADTSAWGGAVELQALSHVLQCQIEVIQATGAPYVIGTEYAANKIITLTYHRHMYELGAHYNSVTKFVKDEES